MSQVALAMEDVGLAMPVQEALEAAGHRVEWNGTLTPAAAGGRFDVVVLAVDPTLGRRIEAWRDLDPPPAMLVVGGAADAGAAQAVGAPFVAADAPGAAVAAAVERAHAIRWTGRLSIAYARGALGLPRAADPIRDAAGVIAGARRGSLDLAREALRTSADRYCTANARIDELRDARALEHPEIEVTRWLDGSRTIRSIVAAAPDHAGALRFLWALVSVEAAALSDEPPDAAIPTRRAVLEARRHVRARRQRASATTAYDLLELDHAGPPGELDQAVRMLGIRFSPDRLGTLDLADLREQVGPIWDQIKKARQVIGDANLRNRHEAKIKSAPPPDAVWWQGPYDGARAEQHFARGQKALLEGETFKAVSEFAAAARVQPDHPDYEASLAWAQFRADVARGKDKVESAKRARATAEAVTYGRRPWPRALVALALLCAASDDAEAARWHLREALTCDPNLPAAQQLLGRLGAR